MAFWPGGTNGAEITILTLGPAPTVRWAFGRAYSLRIEVALDESMPYPLVVVDGRLRVYASSGATSPVIPLGVRLDGDQVTVVTRQLRAAVEASRSAQISRLARCGSNYEDCERGALLGVMATSLLLGDWDATKSTLPVEPGLIAEFDGCRADIEQILADPRYEGNRCLWPF